LTLASWLRWCNLYSDCPSILEETLNTAQFDNISRKPGFEHHKSHLFAAADILRKHANLSHEQKEIVAQKILEGAKKANIGWNLSGNWNVLQHAFSWVTRVQDAQKELKAAVKAGEKVPDPIFIASLEELANDALFVEPATALADQWKQILRDRMKHTIRAVVNKIFFKQEQTLNEQAPAKHNDELEEALAGVRWDFIQALGEIPIPKGSTGCVSGIQAPLRRISSEVCINRPILTYLSVKKTYTSTAYYYASNPMGTS